MSLVSYNPIAIFVAAVLAFALGALWYGPLFGKAWLRLNGLDGKTQSELAKAYVVSFLSFLLMAASLAVLADYIVLATVPQAFKLALLVFGGFVAPVGLMANAFSGRPIGAWLLDAGYQLLYLVLMSLVVVLWL